jgi:hypothetical protein
MKVRTVPVVKLLGIRHLSVLLIGTLLLCHGVFVALHLVCDPLEWCAGGAQHSAEHQTAAGSSARGKELVMQFWTIQHLPRERIGFAKS